MKNDSKLVEYFSIKFTRKLKILGNGDEVMSTLPGLNQIRLEGFCRFVDQGLPEWLFKFPNIEDIDQEIEFQLFVETYQLLESLINEKKNPW